MKLIFLSSFLFFHYLSFSNQWPHIDTIQFLSETKTMETANNVEYCLTQIEASARRLFSSDYKLKVKRLIYNPKGSPLASGYTSDDTIFLSGPDDLSVACHESFHVFIIQAWSSGLLKAKIHSKGLTTPIYEALPQIISLILSNDCLIGRKGRFEFAYNHCQPIAFIDLPTLRITLQKEMQKAKKRGWETKYWTSLLTHLPDYELERVSAYYASIPLGYAFYESSTYCKGHQLLDSVIYALKIESFTQTNTFDSMKQFSEIYLKNYIKYLTKDCQIKVKNYLQPLLK
jgi:hypothetical protein